MVKKKKGKTTSRGEEDEDTILKHTEKSVKRAAERAAERRRRTTKKKKGERDGKKELAANRGKRTETRGGRNRDFWARALHLLACSGTRHTHRLLPLPPSSSLTLPLHPPLSLSSFTPNSILSSLSVSLPFSRALLALPRQPSPLLLPPLLWESPSRVPLSRVPWLRRDRDARESIARGLRQGEQPTFLHSGPLLFPPLERV